MHERTGFLIAIEGIDGAGKTTLAQALADGFQRGGIATTLSKEPTAGPWGRKMRESAASGRLDAREELRLMVEDRRQHVAEVIQPALDRGDVVILDRYFPSTVAYQGAAGLDVDDVLRANAFAPAPDVTLVLDLAPAVGLARIRARGDAPNGFETAATLAAARERFMSMPLASRRVIDAGQDKETVLADSQKALLVTIADTARNRYAMTPRAGEYVRSMGAAVMA